VSSTNACLLKLDCKSNLWFAIELVIESDPRPLTEGHTLLSRHTDAIETAEV